MKIDEISMKIIQHLRIEKKTVSGIAKDLCLSEHTVRSRIKRMKRESILEIKGLVDPDRMPYHFVALVGVRMTTSRIADKAEEFCSLRGVVSVGIVTGQFDIMLQVLLNNEFGLFEFFTREFSKIEGVTTSDTFIMYKTFNWSVPYPL